MDYNELLKEYRRKAKRADQRIVRLEALAHEKHYRGIKTFSYKKAMLEIERFGGKNRFNTKPPDNFQQLQAKVNAIDRFLNSPTSTKKGIKNIYEERAKTTNKFLKENGVNTKLTWQELASFYENKKDNDLGRNDYGSKTELLVLATLKKYDNKEKEVQDILASNNKNMKFADDNVVNARVKELLKENVTFDNIMKQSKHRS